MVVLELMVIGCGLSSCSSYSHLFVEMVSLEMMEMVHVMEVIIMAGLKKANVAINRKMLAEIAVSDPKAFTEIAEIAKKA